MEGSASTASLNSTISPPTGRKASLTVFTASIEPNTSPAASVSPTVGTSTNTMSPSWLCAKSVMPMTAVSPSIRHHSWSFEYFRFAGTFMLFLMFDLKLAVLRCKYNCYFCNSKDLCQEFITNSTSLNRYSRSRPSSWRSSSSPEGRTPSITAPNGVPSGRRNVRRRPSPYMRSR